MLGYVTIEKGELRVREYEIYNGYYCGICKSIGRRIGQIPRLALSYDSVFLALILGALKEGKENLTHEHCIVHHIDRKPVIYDNESVDFAADVMVILAYQKFLDDWNDDRSVKGFAGKAAFTMSYNKVKKIHPLICQKIEEALTRLTALEKEKSGNIDGCCDAFADVMEALFTGYADDPIINRILGEIGRNLGRWIYLIDAVDDLEDDINDGNFNPLMYRFEGLELKEIYEKIEPVLYSYLAMVGNALDLLKIEKNKGIIDNIVFMGLRRRTDNVLKKGTDEDEQSI